MTWTYRTYQQDGSVMYAELEDPNGDLVRRYYPQLHPKLREVSDVARGDEVLPDDGVPAVPVTGFDERDAIQQLQNDAYDALPEDDSEPVTAGALRKVLSLVVQDVEREDARYQGESVDRGWNRGRGQGQNQGQGRGRGRGNDANTSTEIL